MVPLLFCYQKNVGAASINPLEGLSLWGENPGIMAEPSQRTATLGPWLPFSRLGPVHHLYVVDQHSAPCMLSCESPEVRSTQRGVVPHSQFQTQAILKLTVVLVSSSHSFSGRI